MRPWAPSGSKRDAGGARITVSVTDAFAERERERV